VLVSEGTSRMRSILIRLVFTAVLGLPALASTATVAPSRWPSPNWIASWATSIEAADPDPQEPLLNIDGQTVRQRVRLSIGGKQVRVRLSNEYGATPVVIGSATVALPTDPQSVRPESLRPLTFDGRSRVTIPAGAPILSDPVDLPAAPGAEISISLYFPQRVPAPTVHALALKRAIVSSRGDFTHANRIETRAVSESSILLSTVLVPAQPGQRLLVAFGDSVTDGDGSTVDADRNWPSALARRLNINTRAGGPEVAVVNAGIAGNRLLADSVEMKALGSSALARFDRDVLTLPGVTHVLLLEGVNDLGFSGATLHGRVLADASEARTAEDLIGAYHQLLARAKARGVKVIAATLTPFEGVDLPGYYTDSKETMRQAVNTWIRTSGGFDGVIDFDAVLRDPTRPRESIPCRCIRQAIHAEIDDRWSRFSEQLATANRLGFALVDDEKLAMACLLSGH
jgi:lysophospholipase L1-like esterase